MKREREFLFRGCGNLRLEVPHRACMIRDRHDVRTRVSKKNVFLANIQWNCLKHPSINQSRFSAI